MKTDREKIAINAGRKSGTWFRCCRIEKCPQNLNSMNFPQEILLDDSMVLVINSHINYTGTIIIVIMS